MTPDEAKAFLLRQLEPDDGVGEPTTLLGGLRPYRGILPTRCFRDAMEALRILGPQLSARPHVDGELVSGLWTLCHLFRAWALDEDGMLRSNRLLGKDEVAILTDWHATLSYAIMILLESDDPDEAFHEYDASRGETPMR